MKEEIHNHKFIEFGKHQGQYYGIKVDSILDVIDTGKMCILDVHPQVCRAFCSGGRGGGNAKYRNKRGLRASTSYIIKHLKGGGAKVPPAPPPPPPPTHTHTPEINPGYRQLHVCISVEISQLILWQFSP